MWVILLVLALGGAIYFAVGREGEAAPTPEPEPEEPIVPSPPSPVIPEPVPTPIPEPTPEPTPPPVIPPDAMPSPPSPPIPEPEPTTPPIVPTPPPEPIPTPTPVPTAFTFSNVSAQQTTLKVDPAAWTMIFHCVITNPTNQTLTKKLKLMWEYDTSDVLAHRSILTTFSLTLAPNGKHTFVWDGNISNQPIIFKRTTHRLWLEDEKGNRSSVGTVSRI